MYIYVNICIYIYMYMHTSPLHNPRWHTQFFLSYCVVFQSKCVPAFVSESLIDSFT